MLTWKEFCDKTNETAIYPGAGTGDHREIAYLTLGLIGELGELRKAHPSLVDLLPELGDCFWYLARFQHVGEIPFEPGHHISTLGVSDLSHCALWSAIDAANAAKKVLRDGADLTKTLACVGEVMTALLYMTRTLFNVPLHEVWTPLGEHILQPNYDKLMSRKARGKIGGDGDRR